MMRDLFGGGGGNSGLPGVFGQVSNIFKLFQNFCQNPFGALMGLGLNIPQSLSNNPEGMVNYLRSSGRMDANTYSQCENLGNQLMSFLNKKS